MSESIVVGTDGSETAKRAVAEAARLARASVPRSTSCRRMTRGQVR